MQIWRKPRYKTILNPAMRKIYDDVYNRFPEEYSKVFKLSTSDRHYEKFSSATGFGMATDVDEGEEIPYDDPVQGFDSTFTHKKIGRSFIVSRETLEDEKKLSSLNLVNSGNIL